MLEHLQAHGIHDRRLLAALRRVPRAAFLPRSQRALAYADRALPLAPGATLSQPLVVAAMLQAMCLGGGERVLDVGSGSGYTTALLCELAGAVRAVEVLPTLERSSARRLRALGYRNFHNRCGDGFLGDPDHAPFDAILVSAAVPYAPPALLDQLALDGRMVLPVGGDHGQVLRVFYADADRVAHQEDLFRVRFVPLRRPDEPQAG